MEKRRMQIDVTLSSSVQTKMNSLYPDVKRKEVLDSRRRPRHPYNPIPVRRNDENDEFSNGHSPALYGARHSRHE
jgi:hypothetical protein